MFVNSDCNSFRSLSSKFLLYETQVDNCSTGYESYL
jgi:hypothetical protein